LFVVFKYVDVFWDYFSRSAVFMTAGILLLVIAIFLEKRRTRLVEQLQ